MSGLREVKEIGPFFQEEGQLREEDGDDADTIQTNLRPPEPRRSNLKKKSEVPVQKVGTNFVFEMREFHPNTSLYIALRQAT